jgi:hypothetical protein
VTGVQTCALPILHKSIISSNSLFERKESLWDLFHEAIFQQQESGK